MIEPAGTFVTLLTPLASGALAAVRIFGPGTDSLLGKLLDSNRDRELFLARVIDPQTNETIDEAMVRQLPRRLGAEITLHGGVRIVQRTLSACEALGAVRLDPNRPADRDELWRQSLALAKAQGIERPALWADVELALPRARTRAVADWLVGQWNSGLASLIETMLEPAQQGKLLAGQLQILLRDYEKRKKAIDGVRVAIVGPANAGKSTLFNRLVGEHAAIVSDQPGTTRDYVSRWIGLCGVPIELIDTAGLQALAGELESRAVAMAARPVAEADLRLIVLDATQRLASDDWPLVEKLAALGPAVWAINKCDATSRAAPGAGQARPLNELGRARESAISISAFTGRGVDELAAALVGTLDLPSLATDAPGLFTGRQVELVRRALDPSESSDALRALLFEPPETHLTA